ncbi:MAG TPA: prolyl oligopeptidase family serine peptidase [Candidatus Eremiobacteraceae bacterium]|nr:prolyl oligopeptidase family serine peptidase [Candidatus Eremiobacteraceae bacterium]
MFFILASLMCMACAVYAARDSSVSAPLAPPKAERRPLEENLHGTKIIDNYRWLEDSSNADTQKWVAEEMAYTRAVLDPLPGREAIARRLTELLSIGSVGVPQIGGKYYFYTRREGMQNQPVLYVREAVVAVKDQPVKDQPVKDQPGKDQGKDRVLVDVNQLSADGTIALDWFDASEHGKYVAYGTSASGSEMSTLHIIETATGKLLPDTIERTRAASIAWELDNSGFYYTRYPKKGEVPEGQEVYNRHVFYHVLGTDPETDEKIFGEGRDPEDWPSVSLDNDGRLLLISVSQGWTKTELFLMDLKARTPPTRITTGKNFLYSGSVYNGRLYIVTNEDAPRYRMFVAEAGDYERDNWTEIIPQTDAVLQGAAEWGGKIFVQYEQNASSQLKIFDLSGTNLKNIALPAIGSVFGSSGKWNHDEIFYGFQSFTVPPSIYRYDLKNGSTAQWAKVDAPSIDPTAYEVQQEWCNSKDGTRVPMFVVYKKGLKKDGKNPALLTAYGGFNVSLTPSFNRSAYLWLEHGGVYAVANLRGGAEFGEDWHRAGMLDKKQNVFDDMIAAAEHLISEKYTDTNHLAIQGGSNGGLLMGAMITQRPELFRAVVCQVPLLDMLHYQNFQIAKLWVPEYGSAENAEQFRWLYAYSPYHHVKGGTEYPAILFMTADTDTRVDPMHAKKMTALMQAEAKNGASKTRPILLRIESKAGHGAGKPVTKQIEEFTDIYEFLFWQLGVRS